MKFFSIAICISVISTFAAGQPSFQLATVQGLSSCGEYLEARKSNEIGVNVIAAWVNGYISANNFYSSKPSTGLKGIAIPDRPTILAYLDKHCLAYPLDNVFQSTAILVGDLGGFKPPFAKKP